MNNCEFASKAYLRLKWIFRAISDSHSGFISDSKLKGHYRYYGIRGNYRKLLTVYRQVRKAWQYWLSRRSNKGSINWEEDFPRLERLFPLPPPRIVHDI